MFDIDEEDRTSIIDTAIQNNLGSKDEIELYKELSLALELITDEKFYIIESNIKNGLNFNILTPYPDGLPEKVGILFFNVDTNYDINIKETKLYSAYGERHFEINLKKY